MAALLVSLAGCGDPPAVAAPPRTVASARRGSARRRGADAAPPQVDSAERCGEATLRTLATLRRGHSVHGQPLCTEVFNGRFAVVLATGSEREASDVWAVFHNGSRDEIHRVGNWPVGVRIEFGRIVSGWVYLVGRSVAREDQPAGAKVLAIFPLPRPGGEATRIAPLSPLEAELLRSSDSDDLGRRLGFEVAGANLTEAAATQTVRSIAEGGPNALFEHLTPEGAPTLRVWQDGVFQETDYVSPQGDPTSPHVSHALTLLRAIAQDMDCSSGERCVARGAPNGATPPEVLLRTEGRRVVLSALLGSVERAVPSEPPRGGALRERLGHADDLAFAQGLTLDGEVGAVVGVEANNARLVAFTVTHPNDTVETRAYRVTNGEAPRAFGDDSLGRVDSRELHLRDYDGDGGFELVSVGRRGAETVVSVSSAYAPPRVSQHRLVHRLDMLRAAFGEPSLGTLDQRLRGYAISPAPEETACASLERLAQDDRGARAVLGSALMVIDYNERGQPLRGTPRRVTGAPLTRDVAGLLGPFSGRRCADLRCNFGQAWCRPRVEGEEGVLWFGDGGRRVAAISRFVSR